MRDWNPTLKIIESTRIPMCTTVCSKSSLVLVVIIWGSLRIYFVQRWRLVCLPGNLSPCSLQLCTTAHPNAEWALYTPYWIASFNTRGSVEWYQRKYNPKYPWRVKRVYLWNGVKAWGGHGNPLQYSCLENPHGQRSLAGYSSWGCKESDMTK